MPTQIGIGDATGMEVVRLRNSIELFNDKANRQTKEIIKLTRILIWLSTIMTVLVAAQLYIALFN